jgi:LacI family transcriptional regulator
MSVPDSDPICPFCTHTERQVKAGMHRGIQRYKCRHCGRRYLIERKREIAADDIRARAFQLHRQGIRAHEIGLQLGISARNISNWLQKAQPPPHDDHAPSVQDAEIVRDGGVAEAKRRTTVVEVAELAGVSISTVSNYLTNKGRMSEQTRERVREAIATLRFTPSSLVRAIRLRRTDILGVVTYGVDTMHHAVGDNPGPALLSGISHEAGETHHNLLLYTLWFQRRQETSGLEFLDGHIDGLIWVSPELNEPHLDTVVAAGLPAVALLAAKVPAGAGYVAVDNIGGMQKLVDHLVRLGHSRIAYIGPNNASDFVERIEGYRRGLDKNNIEFDPALLATGGEINTSWHVGNTLPYTHALTRWLDMRNRPTAIMASVDRWGLWIARYLNGIGIKVPEDMAVTGFDDLAAALKVEGGLTTIRQDFYQIGRLGTEMLRKLIGGAPIAECRTIYPGEIIVRGSTDATKWVR